MALKTLDVLVAEYEAAMERRDQARQAIADWEQCPAVKHYTTPTGFGARFCTREAGHDGAHTNELDVWES